MGYGLTVEIWGDMALFSRPEMKTERVSYDIITPSAARGILEAIFWHPGMRYIIDQIHVINPIRFTNIRRNEVSSKISAVNVRQVMEGINKPLYISTRDDIQQRAAMVLRDVHYIVEAHFELTKKVNETDNEDKFYAIAVRRFKKGQYYYAPCLGCREFPAKVTWIEPENIPKSKLEGKLDLGYMLYDMDYSDPENIEPMFFRAILRDGILDLRDCEVKK